MRVVRDTGTGFSQKLWKPQPWMCWGCEQSGVVEGGPGHGRGWNQLISTVPSGPNHSMILWNSSWQHLWWLCSCKEILSLPARLTHPSGFGWGLMKLRADVERIMVDTCPSLMQARPDSPLCRGCKHTHICTGENSQANPSLIPFGFGLLLFFR